MDQEVYELLQKINLHNARLIPLKAIEDQELLTTKAQRTIGEYCWTCKPHLMRYIFRQDPQCQTLIYLDADIFFFNTPELIFQEFNNHSIGITPHHFASREKFLAIKTGSYNAGFIVLRRDNAGLKCLNWYDRQCLHWCFARSENGKIGDQGYLNQWPKLFSGVICFDHKGINAGPWNLKNYSISQKNKTVYVDNEPLICYHFHSLELFANQKIQVFSPAFGLKKCPNLNLIYHPYLLALNQANSKVQKIHPRFNDGFKKQTLFNLIKNKLVATLPIIHYLKVKLKN